MRPKRSWGSDDWRGKLRHGVEYVDLRRRQQRAKRLVAPASCRLLAISATAPCLPMAVGSRNRGGVIGPMDRSGQVGAQQMLRPYKWSVQLAPVVASGPGSFTRMDQRGKAKLPALSSTTFTWQV